MDRRDTVIHVNRMVTVRSFLNCLMSLTSFLWLVVGLSSCAQKYLFLCVIHESFQTHILLRTESAYTRLVSTGFFASGPCLKYQHLCVWNHIPTVGNGFVTFVLSSWSLSRHRLSPSPWPPQSMLCFGPVFTDSWVLGPGHVQFNCQSAGCHLS